MYGTILAIKSAISSVFRVMDEPPRPLTTVDKLKDAHSFNGDPIHREAWELIEFLQNENDKMRDKINSENFGLRWCEMDSAPVETEVLLLYKITRYTSTILEGRYDSEDKRWVVEWVDDDFMGRDPIKWMVRPIDPKEIERIK